LQLAVDVHHADGNKRASAALMDSRGGIFNRT
jgi:hypothetical protein